MAGIPSFVCSSPVQSPASTPTSSAASSAAHAGHPAMISITVTAPPVAKLPSTLRSATSSSRKVMYTPNAIKPQRMPCAMAEGILAGRLAKFREAK
jgi:hypothetical protein